MAVFEHISNSHTQKQYIATNNVLLEDSSECVLFIANMVDGYCIQLIAEKKYKLDEIDMSDWKFTEHYTSAFSIYSSFIRGIQL